MPTDLTQRIAKAQAWYERTSPDDVGWNYLEWAAAVYPLWPDIMAKLAILADPQKWMRWCDIRVLEENESLRAQLLAAKQEV